MNGLELMEVHAFRLHFVLSDIYFTTADLTGDGELLELANSLHADAIAKLDKLKRQLVSHVEEDACQEK